MELDSLQSVDWLTDNLYQPINVLQVACAFSAVIFLAAFAQTHTLKNAGLFQPIFRSNMNKPNCKNVITNFKPMVGLESLYGTEHKMMTSTAYHVTYFF